MDPVSSSSKIPFLPRSSRTVSEKERASVVQSETTAKADKQRVKITSSKLKVDVVAIEGGVVPSIKGKTVRHPKKSTHSALKKLSPIKHLPSDLPSSKVLDLSKKNGLTEEQMIEIISSTKDVDAVSAIGLTLLTDKVIKVIAKHHGHQLIHINLSSCTQITALGLGILLKKCPKLTYLDLYWCRISGDLSSLFEVHPSLKTVVFPSGLQKHYNQYNPDDFPLAPEAIPQEALEDGLEGLSIMPQEDRKESKKEIKSREGVDRDRLMGIRSFNYGAEVDYQTFQDSHRKNRGVWRLANFAGHILSASYDHSVGVWDPKTGKRVAHLTGAHKRDVLDVVVIPGEEGGFVTGSADATMVVWNRYYKQKRVMKGHWSGIYSLACLSNGSIVSGSCQCPPQKTRWDYDMRIWDSASGKRIGGLSGHEGAVASLDVMEDGTLVSASADRTVKIWDVTKGVCVRTFNKHKDYVYSVKSLSSGRIASASRDRSIVIWDSRDNSVKKLEGHISTVYSLSPIGDQLLVSGSRDGSVTIWDLKSGKYVNILECPGEYVYSVLATEKGEIIAGLSSGKLSSWRFPAASR